MTEDPIVYQDQPGRRVLDLRPDGVDCIPVLGLSNFRMIHPGTDLHIHRAQELLARGRLSIRAVADVLRFSSTQHFSNVFKRIVGTSPAAYAAGR